MKVDILAIGAHPDDIELSCAGTLIGQIKKGKKVALLDLTRGEMGTRGTPEMRLEEANEAARIMGATVRENAGMRDGFFAHNEDNLKKIAFYIRKYQPEIILANALTDRHPDHGRAAKLISDAGFVSGLKKVKIKDGNGNDLAPWRARVMYHYIQDRHLVPDFVVDITEQMDQKMECILAFKSQFYDPKNKEPNTPISGKDFMDYQRARCATFGRASGLTYAEGFNVQRTMAVEDIFSLV